jgi:uncharacterized protein (UPF0333 family)
MRGLGFIVLLITVVIVAYLTITNLKKDLGAPPISVPGTEAPKTMAELPNQVKKNLEAATKGAEENTKKALQELDKP